MKQANEVVCQIGLVITRIKLFGKSKKRGLDFDESNLFSIWPQHRADCTV